MSRLHDFTRYHATPAMSLDFLITSLIVIASPGIGVLFTLAAGLSRGCAGQPRGRIRVHARHRPAHGGRIMGLAALLHTSALAFQILKYLGVAYLLYMAWSTLRDRGALTVETEIGARSTYQVISTAILINILNPKLSIFFLAFLPQFMRADEVHPLGRMLELSSVFMLLTFVVFAIYGLFAASIRNHVVSRPQVLTWLRRTFAGAFAALGAKLALAER